MADYDLLTIGNAIVDVISRCDDAFLTEHASLQQPRQCGDGEVGEGDSVTGAFLAAKVIAEERP